MMNDYTMIMTDLIRDQEISEEDILAMLNNINETYQFLPFSQLLSREVSLKLGCPIENVLDTFKTVAKEKDISFDRNTLKNWFTGKGPKKSDEAREMLYRIAFVTGMTVNETGILFSNVYRDRAFNLRRIHEFIYFIYLNQHLSYQDAQTLILQAEAMERNRDNTPHTIHTSSLFRVAAQLHTPEDILDYFDAHYSDFCTDNESAIRVKESLLEDVMIRDDEKQIIKDNGRLPQHCSVMAKEVIREDRLQFENSVMTSISFMLRVIYDCSFDQIRIGDGKSVFKNAHFPKEILNRLPTKHTFSKKNPSYEELRKMIILLSSYKFWITQRYEGDEYGYGFEDYRDDVNSYLDEANMPILYPGNPFDWMFLYCSAMRINDEDPLTLFRDLIAEGIE